MVDISFDRYYRYDELTRIGLPLSDNYTTTTVCLLIPLQEQLLIYNPSSMSTSTIPKNVIWIVRDGDPATNCNPPHH
jgi:hypothetical protein